MEVPLIVASLEANVIVASVGVLKEEVVEGRGGKLFSLA
jgi:hypothetical protein